MGMVTPLNKYDIGDVYVGSNNKEFLITDAIVVNGVKKLKIRFIKSGYETTVFKSNISAGTITDKSDANWGVRHKMGDLIASKNGVVGKILDVERRLKNNRYRTYLTVEILETGFVLCVTPDNFKRDRFKDLLKPSVYNVRILGYVDNIISENNCLLRDIKEYCIWEGIIRRCYGTKEYYDKNKAYENATTSEEWKRFDLFYKTIKEIPYYDWWKKFKNENPYDKNIFELDKDILSKHNKIYSKETCIFIPKFINSGYTSWAKIHTKELLLKRLENLTYESVVRYSKQLQYI